MARPYRYETAKQALETIIGDLAILSGDAVGPSDVTWQDVAGTLAVNLTHLASLVTEARKGNVVNGPVVFPSPSEALDNANAANQEARIV